MVIKENEMVAPVKFSIIIPVYNAWKYIDRVLHSVTTQEYSNYEVILVDDESSDDTLSRCEGFRNNEKLKLYSIEHKGAAAARNFGIEKATGDYLVFVDADDYIEPNALALLNEKLHRKAVDCIVCPFISELDAGSGKCNLYSERLNAKKINGNVDKGTLEYISQLCMIFTPWRFVAKTSLIKSHVLFHEGIIHEDEEWCAKLLLKCETLETLPAPYYHYVEHSDSVMTSSSVVLHVSGLLQVCESLVSCMETETVTYKKEFLKRCIAKNLNFARSYITSDLEPLRRIRFKIK